MLARTEQESWEDEEILPIMTTDARRWFLAERERRKGEEMKRTGLFITEEERQQLETAQSVSGMFLSGGEPMGNAGAIVADLNRKHRPGLPSLPIDPENGEFCEP